MKQLKFMLAAATAIGIATAQAATEELDNENFNNYPTTQVVTEINGFSFEGADGDNESAIVEKASGDMALKVNTGTDPLLRQLNTKYKEAIDLTAEGLNSIVIDTKVQFTVTPVGDPVDAKAGDKLMIYLQEVAATEEGGASTTKLMVKAAQYTPADGWVVVNPKFEGKTVGIDNFTAVPGEMYNLTVTAYVENGVTLFKIKLGDTQLRSDTSLYGEDDTVFPSLINGVDAVDPTILTHVGFAGEGTVDDFVVTKDYVASSVDFTLALGNGVSAVQWTINENEMTGADTFSATAGTTLNVAIKSVTYDAGYAGTQDWTAWTYSAAASGSIEITAEKFADVSEGGVVTPTANAVEAVNAGSFMVPEATDDNAAAVAAAKAELGKALTWATSAAKGGKSYAAAIEAITAMNFADTTETATEQAYLLNCAPTEDAIKEKKDAFVFSAVTFDENGVPVVTVDPEFARDVNGRIEIRGATSLDAEDAFTAPKKDGDAFFKAFLVK